MGQPQIGEGAASMNRIRRSAPIAGSALALLLALMAQPASARQSP